MPLRVEGRARTLRGPHPARTSTNLGAVPAAGRSEMTQSWLLMGSVDKRIVPVAISCAAARQERG